MKWEQAVKDNDRNEKKNPFRLELCRVKKEMGHLCQKFLHTNYSNWVVDMRCIIVVHKNENNFNLQIDVHLVLRCCCCCWFNKWYCLLDTVIPFPHLFLDVSLFTLLFDSIGQVCRIIIFTIQVKACTQRRTHGSHMSCVCVFFLEICCLQMPQRCKIIIIVSVAAFFRPQIVCKLQTARLNYDVGLWCFVMASRASTAWHICNGISHSTALCTYLAKKKKKRILHQ